MKLIVGQHAGFCYGVRRAVERASECAAEKLPCATLGPIIHNPQEVERLAREGIRCITTPEEAYPGETVMIRSHGVSPTLIRRIEAFQPDVIHLHNLHGYYLNIEVLFSYLKKSGIPVVWTLHDCWSMTGYCPHFENVNCTQYRTECRRRSPG